MIIHSINAENLLKYRRLDLQNLPDVGTIAISGPNESGKSSIGESICFALFGRSFAVGSDDVAKLIRWGEDRCTVTLEFSSAPGQRYRIYRYMDRDGNHSARLCKADDLDNPVARGVDSVSDALYNTLGYEFDEFIESFYLAQREITTPHPHSYAVKIMAGIAPMEFCRSEFAEEAERERELAEESEGKAAEIDAQLAALAFDPEHLSAAEQARDRLGALDARIGERRSALLEAAEDYQEREPQLRAAESSRGSAGFFRSLFLVLAALVLGLWALLAQYPDLAVSQQLAALLQAQVPNWQPAHAQWLLFAGIGFAVLFVLFWVRAATLGGRIRALKDSGGRLRDETGAIDELEREIEQASATAALASGVGGDATRLAQRGDKERNDTVLDQVDSGEAAAEEVRSLAEREAAWLERAAATLTQGVRDLEERIANERRRQEEHGKLTGMAAVFQQQAGEHRHRVTLREMADDLLLGAARHLSHRFNHNLRGLAAKTLPMFTEGRYEHLKIGDDLTVQAFSSEKRDFMDLDEISSGTQRQIMLALRLALSQELINRVVKEQQFVFLDEPFAFFDDRRTRSSLSVLPKLSEDVKQIFVVGQEFPQDMTFDLRVHCDRDSDSFSNVA